MTFRLLDALGREQVDPKDLARRSNVSYQTVWRAVKAAGDQVVQWRVGRKSRLAATRPPHVVPVRAIDAEGAVHTVEPLRLLRDGGSVWLNWAGKVSAFAGLPPEIEHARPQGFLGRAFAHHIAESATYRGRIASNPDVWDSDVLLDVLSARAVDLPGNLIVGDAAFELYLADLSKPIEETDIEAAFAARAEAAIAGEAPESSAAGEQPKFTAAVRDARGHVRHVIVKFSPPTDTVLGERWADLLAAEHIAGQVLREHQFQAASTELLDIRGRRMLVSERFDRVGSRGRLGVISLRAIDDEYFGRLSTPWVAASYRLEGAGMLSAGDAGAMRVLGAFGRSIANSDMHYGNVSFFCDVLRPGPMALAPIYDMLPMRFAPVRNELRPLAPSTEAVNETPGISRREHVAALEMAMAFWSRCAADDRLSAPFRDLCDAQRALAAKLLRST